ncbi:MAG: hypothetical protein LBK61_12300, partial [Spirochaetaceae bacterium]|nr:hypothetical protein [Spirochaetaceae bacterium]
RRRISLSRKSDAAPSGNPAKPANGTAHGDGKAKVTAKKDFSQNSRSGGNYRPPKDDDGTMYNPFALAFKKK